MFALRGAGVTFVEACRLNAVTSLTIDLLDQEDAWNAVSTLLHAVKGRAASLCCEVQASQ